MVMSGELEVTVRDERTHPRSDSQRQKRLGFLSEGAFFGEAPVMAPRHDTAMLLRTRTVTAVANSELCYLTRDAMAEVCADYPELKARIYRFRATSDTLTDPRLKKMGLTREELKAHATTYKGKLKTTERIREKLNLDEDAYVPSALLP